jgi:DNA (cytosine-5)-methyltransferase 1
MRYLSVCSGIEAATVAWHHMGWTPVAFSEIEKFPSQVLNHHYQSVPNVGDMTKFEEWNLESVELLVGGTPCQSFSVAGLRKGLDDPRGNLMLTYGAIAKRFKPKWLVWENVPGVLSSNGGRDFGTFLGMLAELGYGFAYRVLDAQYFGVAQRRRRVFVVGCLGNWRAAAAVLFERDSLCGNPAPSREKGQVTPTLTKECTGVSRPGHNENGWYVTASTLTANGAGGQNFECGETYIPTTANCLETTCNDYSRADGFNMIGQPIPYDLHQVTAPVNCQSRKPGDPCHTLAKQNAHNAGIVSIQGTLIGRDTGGPNGVGATDDGVMYTLTKTDVHGVAQPINFSSQMSVPQIDFDLCQTLGAKNPQAVAQPIPIDTMNHIGRKDNHSFGDFQPGAPSYTLTKGYSHAVAQPIAFQLAGDRDNPSVSVSETAFCLPANPMSDRGQAVAASMAVRRLTPTECERLQGFPDGYTNIRENCPDGPRYKALGNSMAVPVMRWIGQRIQAVEEI